MLATASKVNFGDDRPLWIWSAALGFASGPGQDRGILDPVEALAFVIHAETDAICLMKDVPALFATNPALVRGLGDAYDAVSLRAGAVVLAYPSIDISSDLRKEVNLLELALPDALELYGLLKALNDAYAETERVSDEWLERVSYATQGLSSNETRDLSNLVDPRFHFSGMDAINESLIMGWTTEYSKLVSPTHELKYVEVSAWLNSILSSLESDNDAYDYRFPGARYEATTTINVNKKWRINNISPDIDMQSQFGRFRRSHEIEGQKVLIRTSVETPGGVIAVGDITRFARFLRILKEENAIRVEGAIRDDD